MGEEKTTPETEKEPDRPDRSQLNAFENFLSLIHISEPTRPY